MGLTRSLFVYHSPGDVRLGRVKTPLAANVDVHSPQIVNYVIKDAASD